MKKLSILFCLFILALTNSCKNTTIVENNYTTPNIIQGHVLLLGIDGDSLATQSGTTISIEGTSFQTTSDTSGNWRLNNVPAGIYNVSITKPGFDTVALQQIPFSGAGTLFVDNQHIQMIPFDSIPVLSVSISGYDTTIESEKGRVYSGTLTFGVSGPDSNTLQYFEWTILNSRLDSPAYSNINNIGGQSITVTHGQPMTFTLQQYANSDYPPYGFNWKTGDTLYVVTKAYAGTTPSFLPPLLPVAFSPYTIIKKVLLP
jgi:hypothetical protein